MDSELNKEQMIADLRISLKKEFENLRSQNLGLTIFYGEDNIVRVQIELPADKKAEDFDKLGINIEDLTKKMQGHLADILNLNDTKFIKNDEGEWVEEEKEEETPE